MAGGREAPRRLEAIDVEAVDGNAQLVEIEARLWRMQGVEQHAMLHWGERIDVFDLMRRDGQGFELRLAELGQRDVGRRQAAGRGFAAMSNDRFELFLVGRSQGLDRPWLVHPPAIGQERLSAPS